MAQRGGQWQQPEYGQPQHMSGQPPQHAPQPQHAQQPQQPQPPQAYGQPPPPQGYGGPGGYGAPAAGDYGGRSSPDPWNAQQLSYQQQQQQYHQQQFARQRAQQHAVDVNFGDHGVSWVDGFVRSSLLPIVSQKLASVLLQTQTVWKASEDDSVLQMLLP